MTTTQMAQEKIESLAAEFRTSGYKVVIRPSVDDLPSFLKQFRPDIIATSPEGNLVVEVKSYPRFDAEEARELAEVVEQNPGWRFDVMLLGPPVAPDVPAQEELLGDEQVTRMLENAEILSKEGHFEAAGLIAYSALETILRRRARIAAPQIERQSSARVLKELYSLGKIHPDTFEKLLPLMEFRNALTHGFQPRNAAPSIPEMIDEIRNFRNAA
jgi:uncharacterized protein YutE (UPF0331/DUF86 family)